MSEEKEEKTTDKVSILTTNFFCWCCRYFEKPVMKTTAADPDSDSSHQKLFNKMQARKVRQNAKSEQARAGKK